MSAGTRAQASAEFACGTGASPLQRFGITWPRPSRDAWALGFAHAVPDRLESGAALQRSDWILAYGRRAADRLRIGGGLRLRSETTSGAMASSYGLDLGAELLPGGDRGPVRVGLLVQNVARPELQRADGTIREPCRLQAAVALARAEPRGWRAAGFAGLEAAQGEQGAAWFGAEVSWRERIEFAVAGGGDAFRIGAGWRQGGARIEYAATTGALRHSLAVRIGLGPTLDAERRASARRLDAEIAARLEGEIASRQAHQVGAWLDEGKWALATRDYDRATERFRTALLWSPEDPTARDGLRRAELGAMLQRADSLVARQDFWSAASQLEHALRTFPGDSLATASLERVRQVANWADRGRSEAAQQVRIGLDAYAAQRYGAAARCFEAALQLDPANPVAAEFMQRARRSRDRQVHSGIAEARSRLAHRDPEGARSVLLPVLDDLPQHAEARRLLVQAERRIERQAQERRVAEARRLEEAQREDRSPPPASSPQLAAAYQGGMQMYRAGDLTAAMRAWEEVARQVPHFGEVDQYLLRVYRVVGLESYTDGRLQQAIEIWGKALKLEPDNPQVRRYLDQANAKLQRAQNPRGVR